MTVRSMHNTLQVMAVRSSKLGGYIDCRHTSHTILCLECYLAKLWCDMALAITHQTLVLYKISRQNLYHIVCQLVCQLVFVYSAVFLSILICCSIMVVEMSETWRYLQWGRLDIFLYLVVSLYSNNCVTKFRYSNLACTHAYAPLHKFRYYPKTDENPERWKKQFIIVIF